MADKCIRVLVSGRVQGVFFRGSTKTKALQLAITGHAKNLADGRVEVLACGEAQQLELFITWLHKGPEYASVNTVTVMEVESEKPSHFSIS